ncbi:MAG TPA: hypothetical protein VGT41_03055 [Candidatus Babeliales bacterium]|nr:hypothetical protein [Candidatus Babeliales bacterium]
MATISKPTVFQKMICATLVVSFGQSAVAAELSTLQPLTSRMYTSVANHISNNRYAYGAPLAAVAGIIALNQIREYSNQCFEKRRQALEDLGFPTSATRMAKRMSMEQVQTLAKLIHAGISLNAAKALNKQYSKEVLENIAYLYRGHKISLEYATDLATTFFDKKILVAIKARADQNPEAFAQCLEALAIANISANAAQNAAHTTAEGMRNAAWDREFWKKILGNNNK